ncbi:polysaccharide deacetylase [Actinomadura sp. NBRC 104412]|uniref:polysaccharide deacetylase family protein n=1 Tax=Actinomadura sp. NBRC 104412 TaxID=3032203 RepID=UPI002556E273|nr:polysaccharide deacetylase [Actinomadura sp. NBRC 104412]
MRPADPVAWPGEATSAASFSFDVDAESVVLAELPAAASRMSVMSHQAYGPLTGLPRLLRILERHGVRSTFFVPGYTAHRHPDAIRSIVDAGHEIAHHGYLHEPLIDVDPRAEAEILDRGLEALETVAGVRPAGYRAPMWELTYASPRLLADRGFLYDSSLMDADVPYELAAGDAEDAASIVEIPVHWGLDDWEQYCFLPGISGSGLIESPAKAVELWRAEFEALRKDGGCFVLTSHPFLSGRPGRAAALEEFVEYVASLPDVWLAPLGDIARHIRGLGLRPRHLPRP